MEGIPVKTCYAEEIEIRCSEVDRLH
jgi:hypothetical protein